MLMNSQARQILGENILRKKMYICMCIILVLNTKLSKCGKRNIRQLSTELKTDIHMYLRHKYISFDIKCILRIVLQGQLIERKEKT